MGGLIIRSDSTLEWAMALAIALSAAILVCIVVSRLLFRGRWTHGSRGPVEGHGRAAL